MSSNKSRQASRFSINADKIFKGIADRQLAVDAPNRVIKYRFAGMVFLGWPVAHSDSTLAGIPASGCGNLPPKGLLLLWPLC
jgi:hypothetical protein